MRLRNIKNKEDIISNSKYIILNPEEYKGKWKSVFDNDNPIYGYLITGKVKTEEGYVYIPTGKVVTGFDEKGNAIFEKDPYSPPKYEPPKSTDTVIGGIYALLNFDKYTTIFREKMGTGEMYVTIDALKAISAKTVAVNTITTLAPIMRDSYKGG